jgi:predicted RNase H-like nuclease (RuvC/YqgF family)
MFRSILLISICWTLTGCDVFKVPKPIKVWSRADLAEFNQDDVVLSVHAEARPSAEVEAENAKLKSENAELQRTIQVLIQRIPKTDDEMLPLSIEINRYFKKQNAEIYSLWNALHKLETKVDSH